MEDQPIKLAELVDAMRRELNIARKQGEGNDFRFTVEEIELEVQFTVEKEFSGEAGATILKVIGAKGGGKYNKETIQRAKLVLKLKDPDKLPLSGEQPTKSKDAAEPDKLSGKTDLVGTLDPSET